MNLKVLFVVFLCLFNASIILSIVSPVVSTTQEPRLADSAFTRFTGYSTNNGAEPDGDGDPVGGGWPK